MGLDANWLNNGPSRGEGGLFQMGLPDGFADRLQEVSEGYRMLLRELLRRLGYESIASRI